MLISDFILNFLVYDIHAYVHFSCVCGQMNMCGMNICMHALMHVCGALRLVVEWFVYHSSTLFTETVSLSQNNRLSIWLISITSLIWGPLSLCFKTAITGRFAYLCGIYMGSWDTNLSLYVCRASVCTAELSFQPGGILCSNQIVTPATNNLISKDSCVQLLTLQNLLYSLEADINVFCLVLPPCWKLHIPPCLWQLFGSWEVLIWDSRVTLAFKGKIYIKRLSYNGRQRWLSE